jgi:hypothetical protein
MGKPTTLGVNAETADKFGTLRIRLAADSGNRIPQVSAIVAALIKVGESHYPELLAELTGPEVTS